MRGVVSIDARKLPAALRRNEEEVRNAIARGVSAGLERGRGIMVRATPTDQGQLRASWHVMRRVNGATGMPRTGLGTVAELRNDAPHAGIVELGARPHGLSPEGWAAIYEWVRRHPELYVSSGSKRNPRMQGPNQPRMRRNPKGGGILGPYRGADPEISEIVNAIAYKLRTKGQEPTYFIRKHLGLVGDAVAHEVKREIDLAAERAGGYGGR